MAEMEVAVQRRRHTVTGPNGTLKDRLAATARSRSA
jgi:hypothetical protein